MHHLKNLIAKHTSILLVIGLTAFTAVQGYNLFIRSGMGILFEDWVIGVRTALNRHVHPVEARELPLAEQTEAVQQNEREPEAPTRLVIPVLTMDLPVVEVPLADGTWPVVDKVANYAQGTALINDKTGNVGLYGHDRADAFRPIKHLKPGDVIILHTDTAVAYYRFTDQELTTPGNVSVFYQTEAPILTLVTCEGRLSEQRFAIRATLERIVPSDAQTE